MNAEREKKTREERSEKKQRRKETGARIKRKETKTQCKEKRREEKERRIKTKKGKRKEKREKRREKREERQESHFLAHSWECFPKVGNYFSSLLLGPQNILAHSCQSIFFGSIYLRPPVFPAQSRN